ncbi:MAG: thioredoxin family protein, partial [Isosphaeraceae bacterium]
MRSTLWLTTLALMLAPEIASAQGHDRNAMVRDDRDAFQKSKDWVYNDLAAGIKLARAENKPLLIVFRCIPCEACQKFDDDVARRDPIIRDLLDKFVCVRIIQANTIDLDHFRYDFDQSFAVILANADLTVYGRYGTRSDRREEEDISLQGLREAMRGALQLHEHFDAIKDALKGKQVTPTEYKTPLDYPSAAGRFSASLDYENQVARSCMHCHQVREAERQVYRDAGEPFPDEVLYPYPDPETLGLKLDPRATALVET